MKKTKIDHYTDKEALDFHSHKKPGKIEISSSKNMTTKRDLALAYSPGVAAPVRAISENPEAAFDYTSKGNLVAVISNGSAILGMGNLGALASKPVMEGKAVLFKRFADIDSIDLEIDSLDSDEIIKSIKNFVEQKDIQAAKTLCRNTDNPVSRMIEKGIDRIDKPMTDISAAIENQGKLEVYKMENNLANLATIAGAAPMIGFLGTVIGMIVAFHEMASAGGNIDVEMLSKGIYTAMVTTVGGLVVGIIAYIAYNYLVSKIDKVIFQLEARTTEFLDLLHHNE